ncbi:hypothetical protein L7F22_027587 [Adiantum nelumboides]|nr:hypothetical protein [Adiantum nelumboides]
MARTKACARRTSKGPGLAAKATSRSAGLKKRPGKPRKILKGPRMRKLQSYMGLFREIRKAHKCVNLCIPKLPFQRMVRSICEEACWDTKRWKVVALMALQEATEDFLLEYFSDMTIIAAHAHRVAVMDKDRRWIVPRVALPTQTKFFFTKKDFHTEYGLCLVGHDPKLLCDDDFSDEEWLRVWLYKRHQKEKMPLKGLRPEMYEECLLLYHKVYQGAPPNNEVGVHFAHGFTWKKCKGAEDFEGLVAWAVYAEGVIKILRQQKTLNRKLKKWRSTNGPYLGSEWKFNAKNMPNYTNSTGTGYDWHTYSNGHQFLGKAKEEFLKKRAFGSMGIFGMSNVSSTTFFASTADVVAISNMKANAAEKLKERQQCLKAIKIALDQSNTKRDEQVGLMQGAAKIIERLNKDMEELKLHKAGLVPNEEAMAKLETLIQIRKEALKDMGLDIEVHNLDNLGEEAAQLQVCKLD